MDTLRIILTIVVPFFELLGIITAMHAILYVRSSQGAIAWAISLVTFPWLALPLYWIFGRNKFRGYVEALRAGNLQSRNRIERTHKKLTRYAVPMDGNASPRTPDQTTMDAHDQVFTHLAGMPYTTGNTVRLLIDGQETFETMLSYIAAAKSYVLLEFFIIRDDRIGRKFRDLLIEKTRQQVKVYFLYDEIGSRHLGHSYFAPMIAAGIKIRPFFTTQGKRNRFQLNFRNHRKILIVDGRVGFVGGHNIGDEYMSTTKKFGAWRDTHVMVEGPAVLGMQLTFNGDWFWAVREKLDIEWNVHPAPGGDTEVLPLANDPSQVMDTCLLFFLNAIMSAKKRLWIATPYFVPNNSIIEALQIAALRGVDVRLILPGIADKKIVYLASFAFFDRLNQPNIKIYRYQPGFMHQKVMLIDDQMSIIGSANFDNRSFNMNFEMNVLVKDSAFNDHVKEMLMEDMRKSRLVIYPDERNKNLLFRLAVRICSLFSPLL